MGYGGGYRPLHGQGFLPKHPHDHDGADHHVKQAKAAEVRKK